MSLEDTVTAFAKSCETKEEAFLKGLLYGYGTHLACPVPNWEMMKTSPDFIKIEEDVRDIFDSIHTRDINEAKSLLEAIKLQGLMKQCPHLCP